MKYSNETKELFTALSLFQSEITNASKTATNPFYNNKYTPLCDVIKHVSEGLAKNGLSVSQFPCSDEFGVGVITIITHKSGQYMESEPFTLPIDKKTSQGGASAITYARRYALAACLGISSEEDDDGNKASNAKKPEESELKQQNSSQRQTRSEQKQSNSTQQKQEKPLIICADCGQPITNYGEITIEQIAEGTLKKFTRPLCYECADKAKESE